MTPTAERSRWGQVLAHREVGFFVANLVGRRAAPGERCRLATGERIRGNVRLEQRSGLPTAVAAFTVSSAARGCLCASKDIAVGYRAPEGGNDAG
jgi:hypothetical protein